MSDEAKDYGEPWGWEITRFPFGCDYQTRMFDRQGFEILGVQHLERRIVACVNACQGIPNPAAEIAGLRAANERLRVLLNEIRKRDYGACKDAIGLPLMEKIVEELDGNALRGTLPPLTK